MDVSGTGAVAPGWYPDPHGGDLRYWDGSGWTEHRQPANAVSGLVEDGWFYFRNGTRVGPVSLDALRDGAGRGELDRTTMVWNAGLPDWVAAADAGLVGALLPHEPPPATGKMVDNRVVWVLAFAPIIGVVIAGFVAGALEPDSLRRMGELYEDLLWVTLGLNVVLGVWDEKRLEKAGVRMEGVAAGWIVPVYLWQRAKRLRQPPSYFWVWLATFVYTVLFE